ncbi:MAG TPA: hypothetical protein PKD05_18850, partial [Candidatus Melainabacteria bacterium]|nr:hypothetical protein [Candidatus Melainabacteria bacterium]
PPAAPVPVPAAEPIQQAPPPPPPPAPVPAVAADVSLSDPSVLELAKNILGKAIELQCSEIHLELVPDGLKLRYMMDGTLLADTILAPEITDDMIFCYKLIGRLSPEVKDRQQVNAFVSQEFGNVGLVVMTIPKGPTELISVSIKYA